MLRTSVVCLTLETLLESMQLQDLCLNICSQYIQGATSKFNEKLFSVEETSLKSLKETSGGGR